MIAIGRCDSFFFFCSLVFCFVFVIRWLWVEEINVGDCQSHAVQKSKLGFALKCHCDILRLLNIELMWSSYRFLIGRTIVFFFVGDEGLSIYVLTFVGTDDD